MIHILQKDIDITHLSNYKTPAKAKYFFEIYSEENIKNLYSIVVWARENSIEILWISSGTNMLFAFEEYKGIVIKNSLLGWTYDRQTKLLFSYGAEKIWEIAKTLEEEYRQDIWHRFIGLPGSVAGAVYGNAGCFGLETENNFIECQVLNLQNGHKEIFSKSDMDFAYRSSKLKIHKKYFLISASFDLSHKIEKYHSDVDNIDFRENKQPKGNSCGSFFKNPSKEFSAGYYIEQVGLKGHSIGGAKFSELHANFLIHSGNGTYKDLLSLIELAQKKVFETFGIYLENEVQIIYSPS